MEVIFDDGDREFLMVDELQCCCISHRPTYVDPSVPTVDTVTEDGDDDIPYSSPMDDTPLDQRPEVMFSDKDEDLPPHLREPRPYGAPNPEEIPRDFSGQTLRTDNPVLPGSIPPDKMLDRTFLMPPEDDGTRHRAKIIALIDNHLAENDFKKQPEHVKFKCLVNDQYEEIVAYNDIVDYIEADDTWDGVWKFCRILDHKYVKPSDKNYMQCSVNALIEWESGETSWQPLHRKTRRVFTTVTLLLLPFTPAKITSLTPKVGNYLDSRSLRRPKSVFFAMPNRLSSIHSVPNLSTCMVLKYLVITSRL